MEMPEAAMDEYYLLMPREDKIRRARQVPSMESITQAHGMTHSSDNQLWLRILGSNAAHSLRAFCDREWIVALRVLIEAV